MHKICFNNCCASIFFFYMFTFGKYNSERVYKTEMKCKNVQKSACAVSGWQIVMQQWTMNNFHLLLLLLL